MAVKRTILEPATMVPSNNVGMAIPEVGIPVNGGGGTFTGAAPANDSEWVFAETVSEMLGICLGLVSI